ncbi:MAG: BrnT family toxin [Pseudomonadota bacterium]
MRFEEAVAIFEGFTLSWVDERADCGEVRHISVGRVRGGVALVVVHTDRSGVDRVISARAANQWERRRYDEAVQDALDG